MAQTRIEWTECSWNPVTGCTKVSPGCINCYAERMAKRLNAMGNPNYRNAFKLTLQPKMLEIPLKWRTPRKIFVNSMSDLFHEDIPLSYIKKVFAVMRQASHHTFQILTKRSERLLEVAHQLVWTPNIWMGVTVEQEAYKYRISHLQATGAYVKFLSCEPLLADLGKLQLSDIDWVIVGGESGPKARPMSSEWATNIRDQCVTLGISFFFKQWGGVNKKRNGRALDGKFWSQWPVKSTVWV